MLTKAIWKQTKAIWKQTEASLKQNAKKNVIASAFLELAVQASSLQDKDSYKLAIFDYNKAVQDCISRGKPI